MRIALGLASATLLSYLVVMLGCSPAARLKLKQFFFEIPPGETAAQADAKPGTTTAPAVPKLQLPPPRYVAVHWPFAQHQCSECHAPSGRTEKRVRPDFLESCESCHERYFDEDEVGHSPVSEGQCTTCHEMHRSVQPHLLKMPIPDMCLECHDEPEDLSEEAHGSGDVDNCIRCHDPHFGTGSLLKKESAEAAASNPRTVASIKY